MQRAGVGDQLDPGEFLALILLIFSNKAAEKLASNFLEANILSPDKRTEYSSDELPFGPIAAAASTLIKEVVSRDALPWSKEEAKRIKASPLNLSAQSQEQTSK
jgi:hypothetical protein